MFTFQISAISESIVRQCEKLVDTENASDLPISVIYQSWVGTSIVFFSKDNLDHSFLVWCND
jgi:hypothetical protein